MPRQNAPAAKGPTHETAPTEVQKRARATALLAWARQHGMTTETDGKDTMAIITSVMRWAAQSGFKGRTVDDVVVWAQALGFKEETGLAEVAAAYERVASNILASGAGKTEIGTEGGLSADALAATGSAFGALAYPLSLAELVSSNDPEIQADAVVVVRNSAATLLSRSSDNLPSEQKQAAQRAVNELEGVTLEASTASPLQKRLGRWAAGLSTGIDVNALVQAVLRDSYLSMLLDLRDKSEKVQFYNDLKNEMRAELARARTALAEVPSDRKKSDGEIALDPPFEGVVFDPTVTLDGETGELTTRPPLPAEEPLTNKEQLRTYVKNLEDQLKTVGDDSQLANVDLQTVLQKQAQTLQTMSNVAKVLHDTAMAIIRKIN